MPRPYARWVATMPLALAVTTCGGGDDRATVRVEDLGNPAEEIWEGDPDDLPRLLRSAEGSPQDWALAREKVDWALRTGISELYFGDLIGALGESFVGATYRPHTLELPGPERLVINVQELDCVTFVENVLALAHMVKTIGDADEWSSADFEPRFREILASIRYRDGEIDGYESRLHYFSEWIEDNESMGLVRDVTRDLGGVVDDEPVDFMSTHPDAYGQLSDPIVLGRIRSMEERLSATARFYLPQSEIADRASEIRNGDIIAATSTVAGLDVAHTGIALWREGQLRLLHAPLVGSHVELSDVPLAERIQNQPGQDGILVARPIDPVNP